MTRIHDPARTPALFLAGTVLALSLSACAPDRPEPADEMPAMDRDTMGGTAVPGAMPGMQLDDAAMRRHAAEMDSMVVEMRQHVQEMRATPPGEWHARVEQHAPRVSSMLGMMERQMREMDRGMNMSDPQMGQMMGMSQEEYRQMLDEMRALRGEVEELQTAPEATVRERMPAHLDRLERMNAMMERNAAHMRRP